LAFRVSPSFVFTRRAPSVSSSVNATRGAAVKQKFKWIRNQKRISSAASTPYDVDRTHASALNAK
jgi:hypothetical protein